MGSPAVAAQWNHTTIKHARPGEARRRETTVYCMPAVIALTSALIGHGSALQNGARPRDAWSFRTPPFVIGAWWGPASTDAAMRQYRDAGFNVVMGGRYMQGDSYGSPDRVKIELDLARRHRLTMMLDTYTKNDRPWGGIRGETDQHPSHHPASLAELKWLVERYGRHPALGGFMVGDDQGAVSPRASACTAYLHSLRAPHLVPWLCGWIPPAELAKNGNPFCDPQIYPTLYEWGLSAEELARRYCLAFNGYSQQCRAAGVVFWPMINTTLDSEARPKADMFIACPSDSLVRFPAYAALAYGAEGLWYFTYSGGGIVHVSSPATPTEAAAAATPLYEVVRRANRRIAAWGPMVVGRDWPGVFGTAFRSTLAAWPFPADLAAAPHPDGLALPGPGKLVASAEDGLIMGVLTSPGRSPLVMVVDCRTSKGFGDLPNRRARITFDRRVTGVTLIEPGSRRVVRGPVVQLDLEPGGGQMLELRGSGLDALTTPEAIADLPAAAAAPETAVPDTALSSIRRALLRLEVYGADSRPEFDGREITVNGEPGGAVPGGGGDLWSPCVIELPAGAVAAIRRDNTICITTVKPDAWKFRSVQLAVQMADGRWAKTSTDPRAQSSRAWAYSEGVSWGADGRAAPIRLALP